MNYITLRGNRWKVVECPSLSGGLCDNPGFPDKELTVPIEGEEKYDLDVLIHESLHACFWDMDEEAITESATDIANFLWKLGWRKEA